MVFFPFKKLSFGLIDSHFWDICKELLYIETFTGYNPEYHNLHIFLASLDIIEFIKLRKLLIYFPNMPLSVAHIIYQSPPIKFTTMVCEGHLRHNNGKYTRCRKCKCCDTLRLVIFQVSTFNWVVKRRAKGKYFQAYPNKQCLGGHWDHVMTRIALKYLTVILIENK